jgi:hypothetical protein
MLMLFSQVTDSCLAFRSGLIRSQLGSDIYSSKVTHAWEKTVAMPIIVCSAEIYSENEVCSPFLRSLEETKGVINNI